MVRSLLDEHEEKKRGKVEGRKASASKRDETTNANEQKGQRRQKEIGGDGWRQEEDRRRQKEKVKRERPKTAVERADGYDDETREHVARQRIYEARDLVRAQFVINARHVKTLLGSFVETALAIKETTQSNVNSRSDCVFPSVFRQQTLGSVIYLVDRENQRIYI